ncbi:taste receptor type 2 member 134-like [Rana temporaria]|uniref:taste receptor type 2 member 134-like n=1 Tax=Rana temporaria TaxID=8407 RepID=UPI001AAC4DEE|nr:taste receptor type 2 member 134-like [Rana temporaria]
MPAAEIGLVFFVILSSCSGMFLNVLVASSSFGAWRKDKFQTSQDLIVFFMGSSCAVFSGFQFLIDMSSYFWVSPFQGPNLCLIAINSIYNFIVFFSISMTAWLCVFYCVKIVSLNHHFLIAMKSGFLANLPRLIAGTFFISSVLLIVPICVAFTSIPVESADNSTIYCQKVNHTLMDNVFFITGKSTLIVVVPFLLIMLSLGTTVTSLVRHVRRIQISSVLHNSNVQAHVKAAKIMTLLLILNVSFYLSSVILNWKVVIGNHFVNLILVNVIIYYIFWPLQALTLLFRNPNSSPVAFVCFCRWPSV